LGGAFDVPRFEYQSPLTLIPPPFFRAQVHPSGSRILLHLGSIGIALAVAAKTSSASAATGQVFIFFPNQHPEEE
jgi:hypothetical protein